jgi:Nuclease-related domain
MLGKRHDGEPACGCHLPEVNCAALSVRQLSQERVHELVEEIWAGSTGDPLPAGPMPDPRRSQPGASAQAAYRRRRQLDREAWRPRRAWRAGAACAAAVATRVLIGGSMDEWLAWRVALLVALLIGWRLRFRPSPTARVWRRQAAVQRRTAGKLVVLEQEGYLVLHDLTLPGWPASLDHLVIGPTGIWVIKSWPAGWLALLRGGSSLRRARGGSAGMLRGLRGEAAAVAEALAGDASISVRPLVCASKGIHAAARWSVQGIPVATPRRLADVVRRGSRVQRRHVELATARALEILRPAA